jgi:hypothetical protein
MKTLFCILLFAGALAKGCSKIFTKNADEVAVGVLKNDQLVCDDAVDNLLFLRLGHAVKHSCLMQLVYASAVALGSI